MTLFRNSTSKFKTKLRLFSFSSTRLLPESAYTDCLADSPFTELEVSSCFLTPLNVRNPDHFTPLTDYAAITLGNEFLPPPPPPRRKLSFGQEPVLAPPFEKAPKVRPFVAASQLKSNGSISGQLCSICDELLVTKLELEQLVQLNCGDCVHSECLVIAAESCADEAVQNKTLSQASSRVKVESVIFPVCRGSVCTQKLRALPVIPVDDEIIRQILDDVMLSLKLTASTNTEETEDSGTWSHDSNKCGSLSDSLKDSWSSGASAVFGRTGSAVSGYSETSASTAASSIIDTAKRVRNLDLVLSPHPILDEFCESGFVAYHRDRQFERDTRPTSPAFSNLTNATVSVRISLHQLVLLEHLRSSFIRHMVQSNDSIDFSVLVAVGALRLVDRLQVSFDQGDFSEAVVYLFLNYLVIWREGHQVEFFDLRKLSQIHSSSFCVLLLRFDNMSSLVELGSDEDSIVQKWGIALSDPQLVFPLELFSSTILVSETSIASKTVVELKSNGVPLHNSFAAKVSPILEDDNESSTPKKTKVSPSQTEIDFGIDGSSASPRIYPTVEVFDVSNIEGSTDSVGVYVYSSRPTTPLNIPRFPSNRRIPDAREPGSDSDSDLDSDSDSDSDEELIDKVTRNRQ